MPHLSRKSLDLRCGSRFGARMSGAKALPSAARPCAETGLRARAGTKAKSTNELTQTSDGRIYIRYLPAGVQVGDQRPDYLTVGTYPQADAMATLEKTAAKTHAETIELSSGGLASIDKTKPTSVYVAYPGVDLQIEVYDPSPSRARQLVTTGRIAPGEANRSPSRSE